MRLLLLPCLLLLPQLSSSLDDGLARTPPRGWRSWNLLKLNVTQQKLLAQAAALARTYPDLGPSLLSLGYDNVGLDDGWQKCGAGVNGTFHNASGWAIWDSGKFPSPEAMSAEVKHKYGVGVGWYSNNCYCHELPKGKQWPYYGGGHTKQDAEMAKQFGFVGMKNRWMWAGAEHDTVDRRS